MSVDFNSCNERSGIFTTNSNFRIIIYLQPDGVKLYYFKLILHDPIDSLKYRRSMTLGFKDIEIRKSQFEAKTHFLLSSLIGIIMYIVYLLFSFSVFRQSN